MSMTKVFNMLSLTRFRHIHHYFKHLHSKYVSVCLKRLSSNASLNDPVQHIVLVSDSTSIVVNLALEDWIFHHGDLDAKSYLLMWKNSPTVVVGRHQNPWMECNMAEARKRNVEIVRRMSGGGTVYHDYGNVNFSFIMSHPRYDRRHNLELVVRAITSRWDVDLMVNKRDDIILNGTYKVSGTASKLSGNKTYHHFTFLLDVDTENLDLLLKSKLVGAQSKATASVPARVMNVRELVPEMTYNEVVETVGHSFLQHNHQQESCIEHVNPSEDMFPGLDKSVQTFQSWEYIFGKTPKFSIFRHFSNQTDETVENLKIEIMISKGRIEDISLELYNENEQFKSMGSEMENISSRLIGLRYLVEEMMPALKEIEDSGHKTSFYKTRLTWILDCIKHCI